MVTLHGDELPPPDVQKSVRSLTARTVNSFLWAASGSGSQAFLKILVLAVLARLISPAEFGIVSAALTVVALAELFGQIGVAPSLIQAQTLDERTIRTASTITIMAGFVAGLVLFIGAPIAAAAFQMPDLGPVVQVFALIFVISGFAVVPEALLQREMRFKTIAIITLLSYLFGYALPGIILAYLGFGVWALVWAQVLQYLCASLSYVIVGRHSARPLLDRIALHHLFRFGAGVTLSRLGNYVALNADYVLVGRWLGADALGFYSRAYTLLVQPAQLVGTVAEKVLFPALSSVQGETQRMLRGYYRAMALVAMTNLPLSAVLVVLAPEIIHVLLGPNWTLAVLPFQILVCSLVFRTAYKLTGTLLRARGAVYLLALWQWIYAALVIVGAMAGLSNGLAGVAVGVGSAIILAFGVGIGFTGFAVGTSARIVAGILSRYGGLAIVIAAALVPLRASLVDNQVPLAVIAIAVAMAGAIYVLAALLLPRLFGEEGIWLRGMMVLAIAKMAKLGNRVASSK